MVIKSRERHLEVMQVSDVSESATVGRELISIKSNAPSTLPGKERGKFVAIKFQSTVRSLTELPNGSSAGETFLRTSQVLANQHCAQPASAAMSVLIEVVSGEILLCPSKVCQVCFQLICDFECTG